MPKIIIAGGTGFIGSFLKKKFLQIGWEVKIISRQKEHIQWQDESRIVKEMDSAAILLNLAGKSVNCRHTPQNKQEILHSRIETTATLGRLVLQCTSPPPLWLNASSMGIYPVSEKQVFVESSTDFANDFLGNVTREWEKTFFGFKLPHTRQIALRISTVLGRDGGAFPPLFHLAQAGLGGTQASGRQIMSWIHISDFYRVIYFIFEEKDRLPHIIHVAAPNAISNREFMKTLRKAVGVPVGLPAHSWAIKLGAALIGTESSLLLDSHWIYPQVLSDAGFKFLHPTAYSALGDLVE